METKPQKSDLWIWTTLWLTTLFGSAIIYAAFLFASLFFLHSYISGFALHILDWILVVIAIYLGSLVSVNYVLKRSIVSKDKAISLTFKTTLIPVIFLIIRILLSISNGTFTKDFLNIQSFRWLFIIVGVFLSVQYLISKKGD
jgi:hypothetical protein